MSPHQSVVGGSLHRGGRGGSQQVKLWGLVGFRGELYPLAFCFVPTFPDDEIEKNKIDHSGEYQAEKHH